MEQYQNTDGVVIQAERITDESHEHYSLWHVIDANGNEGHIPDEQFVANFSKASAKKAKA